MDRFTWGLAGGGLLLCAVALASVALSRRVAPPSLTTPSGVVAAYLQAVRDRDSARAWDLLAPNANIALPGGIAANPTTRATFERDLAALPSHQSQTRIHVLSSQEHDTTASVKVAFDTSNGSLFGSDVNQTFTFTVVQLQGSWRIETAPPLYEIG